MVRNTWFRGPITSMKGKKSNSAEIKLLNVHVVEDLRICDKYSHVTLLNPAKRYINTSKSHWQHLTMLCS